MDKLEIDRKARERLPNIEDIDVLRVVVPVAKELNIVVAEDKLVPELYGYYEVTYLKRRNTNNIQFWELEGIREV